MMYRPAAKVSVFSNNVKRLNILLLSLVELSNTYCNIWLLVIVSISLLWEDSVARCINSQNQPV